MTQMLSFAAAQSSTVRLAQAVALNRRVNEVCPLDQCLRRSLAVDLRANHDQPMRDVSAMDGYALGHALGDTLGDTLGRAVGSAVDVEPSDFFKLIGESRAGKSFVSASSCASNLSSEHALQPGQAVRIFTGAAVPEGTHCVLIQEKAAVELAARVGADAQMDAQMGVGVDVGVDVENSGVRALESVVAGQNIRRQGIDFTIGDLLLSAGTVLGAAQLSLAASLNIRELTLYRRPKVALIANGSELVSPGLVDLSTPGAQDRIIETNSYSIAALMHGAGAEVISSSLCGDDKLALAAAVETARLAGADIIILIGGASVGDYDYAKEVLRDQGGRFEFQSVAMKPGKPSGVGAFWACDVAESAKSTRVNARGETQDQTQDQTKAQTHADCLFLSAPGNPISALTAVRMFAVPMVRCFLGQQALEQADTAIVTSNLKAGDQRLQLLAGSYRVNDDARLEVQPLIAQDSSRLTTLAGTNPAVNCLVVREANCAAAQAGERVKIYRGGYS